MNPPDRSKRFHVGVFPSGLIALREYQLRVNMEIEEYQWENGYVLHSFDEEMEAFEELERLRAVYELHME